MGLPALKETFQGLSILPPTFRFSEAMATINDAKAFERTISQAHTEIRQWRFTAVASLRDSLETLTAGLRELPHDQVVEVFLPLVDGAIADVDDQLAALAVPYHDLPENREVIGRLRSVGGAGGRYLRKQINRIEDMRVYQTDTLTDIRYGLLAFRSEIAGEEPGPTFDNAEDLAAFLRSEVA